MLASVRRLLDELPHLPDLQCAWLLLLLLHCASPCANHALRTLPPSESASYDPCQRDEPPLERVLELAGAATSPSRLPLRS